MRNGKVLGPLQGACGGGPGLNFHGELGRCSDAGDSNVEWACGAHTDLDRPFPGWENICYVAPETSLEPGNSKPNLGCREEVEHGDGTAFPSYKSNGKPGKLEPGPAPPPGSTPPSACALRAPCATPSGHSALPPFRWAQPRAHGRHFAAAPRFGQG